MNTYLIDIYIVDDHQMVCEGLTDIINKSRQAHVSRSFTTLEACRQTMATRRPDMLLLDLSMPDGNGIEFCKSIIRDYPKVKVIAVTIHDEYSMIKRMMECGAHGYVLKSSSTEELLQAIVTVWQGRQYVSPAVQDILNRGSREGIVLTNVESNILRLICDGFTNPEIAAQLNISTETTNWYRKRLLAKFGVRNTVSLVRLALEQKLC